MKEHPIDDLFHQGLGKYRAAVPPQAWEKIAANQAKQRRARNGKRWAFGGTILALLLAVPYFWLRPTANTELVEQADSSLQHSLAAKEAASSPLSPSEKSSAEFAPVAKAEKVAPASQESFRPQSTTTASPSTNIDGTSNERATALGHSTLNHKTPKKLSLQTAAALPPNSTELKPPTASHSTASHSAAQTVLTDQNEAKIQPFEQTVTAKELGIAKEAARQPFLEATQQVASLPLPRLAPYTRPLPQPLVLPSSFKKAQKKSLYLDLLAGLAYAHQSLTLRSEEDRSDLSAREVSEFPAASNTLGALINYPLSPALTLRAGLGYTLIRNRFEYEQLELVGVDSIHTTFVKSSNRIRLVELPFLLAYELPGKRFHLALEAGAIVNISAAARGRYLVASQLPPLLLEDEPVYRSRLGMSWQVGLTAAYDLGQGNSLLISPSFRSYTTAFTQPTYNLEERYWLAGLQLGLRHRL